MPRPSELELKRLALLEFRAKKTAKQAARNIRQMLGPSAIKFKLVEDWFRSFKNGTTNIFTPRTLLHRFMKPHKDDRDNGLSWIVHSLSMVKDACDIWGQMRTIDGRLALYKSPTLTSNFIALDIFHGHIREITFPAELAHFFAHRNEYLSGRYGLWSRDFHYLWEIVDVAHLIAFKAGDSKQMLHLFQIDYKEWKMKSMASVEVNFVADHLVLDCLDRRNFVLASGSVFVTGVVTEISIHVSEAKASNAFSGLSQIKMEGGKVYGIRSSQEDQPAKFLALNLDTLEEKSFVLPTFVGRDVWIQTGRLEDVDFAWSGPRLYIAQHPPPAVGIRGDTLNVFSFNTDTRAWSDTGIVIPSWSVNGFFVDRNEILVVQMYGGDSWYFGRFPMKKSDSLKNLAWLTMVNMSKLFGTGTYDCIINRLPYNCEFRSLAPDECEGLDDIEDEHVKTSDSSGDSD